MKTAAICVLSVLCTAATSASKHQLNPGHLLVSCGNPVDRLDALQASNHQRLEHIAQSYDIADLNTPDSPEQQEFLAVQREKGRLRQAAMLWTDALSAIETDNLSQAMTHIQGVRILFPLIHQVHCFYAEVLLVVGDQKRAVLAYQDVVQIDPDNFVAHSKLGGLYLALQQYSLAESHYRAALRQEPNSGIVLQGLASSIKSSLPLQAYVNPYLVVHKMRLLRDHGEDGVAFPVAKDTSKNPAIVTSSTFLIPGHHHRQQQHDDEVAPNNQQSVHPQHTVAQPDRPHPSINPAALPTSPSARSSHDPTRFSRNFIPDANFVNDSRVDEALRLFQAAIKFGVDNPDTRIAVATILIQREEWEAACDHLSKAVTQWPQSAQARYQLASVLQVRSYVLQSLVPQEGSAEASGLLASAIAHLQQATWLDGNMYHAQFDLAKLLWLENRRTEALHHIKTALKLKPESFQVNVVAANVYHHLNQHKDAADCVSQALLIVQHFANNQPDQVLWEASQLPDVFFQIRDDLFANVFDEDPGPLTTHALELTLTKMLAQILHSDHQFRAAIYQLKHCIEIDPRDLEARVALSRAQQSSRLFDEAELSLSVAQQRLRSGNLSPMLEGIVYLRKAQLLHAQLFPGDPADAHPEDVDAARTSEMLKLYDMAFSAGHDDMEGRMLLGKIHMNNRQWNLAVHHLHAAVNAWPESSRVHRIMGELLFRQESYPESLHFSQLAALLDPKCVDCHLGTGEAFLRLGKFHRAMDNFRSALRLSPMNLRAQLRVGDAFMKLNQYEGALDSYYKALKLLENPDVQRGSPASDRTSFQVLAQNNIAVAQFHLGDLPKAVRWFQKSLAVDHENHIAQTNLAQMLAFNGPESTRLFYKHLARRLHHTATQHESPPDQVGDGQTPAESYTANGGGTVSTGSGSSRVGASKTTRIASSAAARDGIVRVGDRQPIETGDRQPTQTGDRQPIEAKDPPPINATSERRRTLNSPANPTPTKNAQPEKEMFFGFTLKSQLLNNTLHDMVRESSSDQVEASKEMHTWNWAKLLESTAQYFGTDIVEPPPRPSNHTRQTAPETEGIKLPPVAPPSARVVHILSKDTYYSMLSLSDTGPMATKGDVAVPRPLSVCSSKVDPSQDVGVHSAASFVQLGQMLLEAGDLEESKNCFRAVVDSKHPVNAPIAQVELASILEKQGDKKLALAEVLQATRFLQPMQQQHLGALLMASRLSMELQPESELTVEFLKQVTGIHQRCVSGHYMLAVALVNNRQFRGAKAALANARRFLGAHLAGPDRGGVVDSARKDAFLIDLAITELEIQLLVASGDANRDVVVSTCSSARNMLDRYIQEPSKDLLVQNQRRRDWSHNSTTHAGEPVFEDSATKTLFEMEMGVLYPKHEQVRVSILSSCGDMLLNANVPQESANAFLDAIKESGRSADPRAVEHPVNAYRGLAMLLKRDNQAQLATTLLRAAVHGKTGERSGTKDHLFYASRLDLARTLVENGQSAWAVLELLDTVVEENTFHDIKGYAIELLVHLLRGFGYPQEANHYLRKLIQMFKDTDRSDTNENNVRAAEQISMALLQEQVMLQDAESYIDRARQLIEEHRLEEARENLNLALSLVPNNCRSKLLTSVALLRKRMGDPLWIMPLKQEIASAGKAGDRNTVHPAVVLELAKRVGEDGTTEDDVFQVLLGREYFSLNERLDQLLPLINVESILDQGNVFSPHFGMDETGKRLPESDQAECGASQESEDRQALIESLGLTGTKAMVLKEMAQAHERQKSLYTSLVYFRGWVREDPESMDAHFGLANLLIRVMREQADELYRKGAQHLDHEGLHSMALEHYYTTFDLYTRRVDAGWTPPTNATMLATDARCGVGMVFLEQGHLDDAMACFELVSQTYAETQRSVSSCATLGAAAVMALHGQWSESRALYKLVFGSGFLSKSSGGASKLMTSPVVFEEYGKLMYHVGEFQEAVWGFEEAIKLSASNSNLHFVLGNARYRAGDLGGASKAYQTAFNLGFDMKHKLLNNFAVVQASTKKHDSAVELFKQVLSIPPSLGVARIDTLVRQNLALVYEEKFQLHAAGLHLRALIQGLNPRLVNGNDAETIARHVYLQRRLVQVSFKQGEDAKALDILDTEFRLLRASLQQLENEQVMHFLSVDSSVESGGLESEAVGRVVVDGHESTNAFRDLIQGVLEAKVALLSMSKRRVQVEELLKTSTRLFLFEARKSFFLTHNESEVLDKRPFTLWASLTKKLSEMEILVEEVGGCVDVVLVISRLLSTHGYGDVAVKLMRWFVSRHDSQLKAARARKGREEAVAELMRLECDLTNNHQVVQELANKYPDVVENVDVENVCAWFSPVSELYIPESFRLAMEGGLEIAD